MYSTKLQGDFGQAAGLGLSWRLLASVGTKELVVF